MECSILQTSQTSSAEQRCASNVCRRRGDNREGGGYYKIEVIKRHCGIEILTGYGCFAAYLNKFSRLDSAKCYFCTDANDDALHTLFICDVWETRIRRLQMLTGGRFSPLTMIQAMLDNENVKRGRYLYKLGYSEQGGAKGQIRGGNPLQTIRLVILPKKPRANQCENFRTLSLISHVAKLLAIIVSKQISKRIEARLENDQYGFRKNKGTREAILGLRVILEKQIERQKITYMAFVDLEKAFDSINWTSLFKILEETEIDFKGRRILYKIYEEQETIININTTTVTAKIQKGVRQGCPLSPAIFNVFIEKAINTIKLCLEQKGIGVKIGGVLITMLRFADDIVVLATSKEDLQAALNAMKINVAKTKTLVCYKKNIPSINITLENKEITQVDYFKYLSSIITDDGKSIKEIRSRIGQANNTFLKKRILLTSKNMNIVTKKQLLKTYVWSVALYGNETWTINKREKDMLEAFEMWCWRKIRRISWIDRRSNEDILRTIDEKRTLIDIIKKRRWQMIGHTLRHGNELHSIIIEGMIEGTRARGRPRTRYISQIMRDARVTSYRELKNIANDREKWRSHLL
ncbi:Reverse transcriptase domain [Cinara cedri]|uniref:Reverse transcriptase domain n=1 Tax=Cinara cedri TaxID=506608 RepID=A0A5E4NC90_9HEMI|nr:Reverse transcriptase domain [Cinara cedri]